MSIFIVQKAGFGLVLVVLISTATELCRVGAIKPGLGSMLYHTINFADFLAAGVSLAINYTRTYVLRR